MDAALNIQVMRDLPQFWNVQATVRYLPEPSKVPAGVWPVQLVKRLPPGERARRWAPGRSCKTLATGDFDGVIDLWDVCAGSPAAAAATPGTASAG